MASPKKSAKSLKGGAIDGVVTPPDPEERDENKNRGANLVTLGQVRSEMGKVYNQHKRGEIGDEQLTKKIWALRQIGQTVESIEKLGLASATGDDGEERPVFTGLQVIPPAKALEVIDGGKAEPTEKGKTNGT